VKQIERLIYDIPFKDEMPFTKEFSIHFVKVETWWQTLGIPELGKRIE
jgi:hypothetical protein